MTWEREALVRLLDGTGAHVQTSAALDALTEEQAAFCPDPWPHSCHRILLHVVYWQDLFLARLE
ncbi:MAG TPA: hypothetical protein VK966_04930, partial [Longimicrobiales bacterium]|nr:hypothetical protein [Longimicrobiales bacterium]